MNSNSAFDRTEVTITVQGADVALLSKTVGGQLAVNCTARSCQRQFRTVAQASEHAASVHTFSDIEQMVGEQVREQYAKPGDYKVSPPKAAIYAWVRDISEDWVVFVVEGTEMTLFKADYSIADTKVTLGAPVEVVRRTTYDPVKGS